MAKLIMFLAGVFVAMAYFTSFVESQDAEEPAVVKKIACMRTKIPPAFNTKVEDCCKKQDNGCRKFGHFRTAVFCAIKSNPASTGTNDFETIRKTCANDSKNNNKDKDIQDYKIRDCVFDTMERNCSQRKEAVSSGRRSSGR